MRQALIASRQARRQAGLAQGAAALRDAGIQLADADAAGRAGAASTRALISFGESAVRHGSSVIG
ncbi:MAG: hypothetical protein ACMVY4_07965 [Minwuia sp.]|uniref:hypothetical protein n=1 Tax=Minwuia sp. TaxID=2493630 RepID=UPI003A8A9289